MKTAYQERLRNLLDQGDDVMRPIPESQPYVLPVRHPPTCVCSDCMTAAQHLADYEKARTIFEQNGF